MTGTDLCVNKLQSVLVIFEPPCILLFLKNKNIIIMYCADLNSTCIKKKHANKINVYHNCVQYFLNMFLSTLCDSLNFTFIYCR